MSILTDFFTKEIPKAFEQKPGESMWQGVERQGKDILGFLGGSGAGVPMEAAAAAGAKPPKFTQKADPAAATSSTPVSSATEENALRSYLEGQGMSGDQVDALVNKFRSTQAEANLPQSVRSFLQNNGTGGMQQLINPLAAQSWYSQFIQPQLASIANQSKGDVKNYLNSMEATTANLSPQQKAAVEQMAQTNAANMGTQNNLMEFAAQNAPATDALTQQLSNASQAQQLLQQELAKGQAYQLITGSGGLSLPGFNSPIGGSYLGMPSANDFTTSSAQSSLANQAANIAGLSAQQLAAIGAGSNLAG